MRRIIAILAIACAGQAAHATSFIYDSGFSTTGFSNEISFTFSTDVTNGMVTAANGGFTQTSIKLFEDGKQFGSGDFFPVGYIGNVTNNVLSLSFSAPTEITSSSPLGGPPISGKGPPINFNGNVAAVPEPASWALMFAGFGLVGAGLRRRRMMRPA